MGKEQKQLHIFFFPMMAHGHMIPILEMTKLFSSTTNTRGGTTVKSTIITTPLNCLAFSNSSKIDLQILDFPSAAAGLPEGVENLNHCTLDEMQITFFKATALLQELLERLLGELRPDYLVADMFFPWATRTASRFGIPRLVFHGTNYFAICAWEIKGPFGNVFKDLFLFSENEFTENAFSGLFSETCDAAKIVRCGSPSAGTSSCNIVLEVRVSNHRDNWKDMDWMANLVFFRIL